MMTQRELAVGDTILVELDEGDRIKGTTGADKHTCDNPCREAI